MSEVTLKNVPSNLRHSKSNLRQATLFGLTLKYGYTVTLFGLTLKYGYKVTLCSNLKM